MFEFLQSKQESEYAEDLKDSVMYKEFNSRSFSKDIEKYYTGEVRVLYDDPKKNKGKSEKEVVYLKSYLKSEIEEVSHTFELISPYFVPGSKGIWFLTEMVKRGIKVRVVTNSLSSTDGVIAQSGYSRSRIKLLAGGVELYELKADSRTKASKSLRRGRKAKSGLHAKVYVFDVGIIYADVPSEQIVEVNHLISYIKNSHCSINRNGTRHPAPCSRRRLTH